MSNYDEGLVTVILYFFLISVVLFGLGVGWLLYRLKRLIDKMYKLFSYVKEQEEIRAGRE